MTENSGEIQAVFDLFSGTVSSTPGIREQAENQLKMASKQPGFGSILLQVISHSSSTDLGVRQACAVYFKNYIDKFWLKRDESSSPSISGEKSFSIAQIDREFIQMHLVEAVVNASPAIRSQLLTCVNRIIRYEFPNGFQMVNQQALHLLQSANTNAISAGLLVTLEILKFRSSSSDKNLEAHLTEFMPHILHIGQQAIGSLSNVSTSTPEVHAILKTVIKSFFTSIRYKFSKHLLSNSENFVNWCTLMMQILQAPVPSEDLKAKDSDDSFTLDKTLFWKMKKWTFRAQNRIASRYGCVEEAKSLGKSEIAFSKIYSENFAEAVLNVNLLVIQSSINGEAPLTDKTCNLLTSYLTVCVKGKKTWKFIRPHVQLIISHFLFPKICFSAADEELWADDPQEFLKTVFFSFDDYDSIVSSCSGLILDIVKSRKKDTFSLVLSFINSVMDSYAAQPNSIAAQRQKDGALYLMGSLAKVMLASEIKNDLEPFLSAHVVPDLFSTQKFLRLRAAWCLEQFDEMQWKNLESSSKMVQGLMNCLEDSELPVRAQACVTIGSLLDQEFCEHQLTPQLGKIVQITLQLTSQVELDSLSYVMDRLVSMFPTELTPYAEELTTQLRNNFLSLLDSSLVRNEESGDLEVGTDFYFNDTDKMMAAIALLETLETVIAQMCSNPETCARVEQALIPLFMVVVQRRLVDITCETVSLVESITYKRKEISPEMWPVFNEILAILSPDAMPELIVDCSTTLENFISYGTGILLQHPEYLKKLFLIIDEALTCSEDGGYDSDSDKMSAVDMIESILLYCRGHVDKVIPHVLDLIGNQLLRTTPAEEETSKVNLIRYLEIVLNCLYYSAPMTLNHLHRQGWLNVFLNLWSQNLDNFKRVHDLRLIIVSLASIFHVPIESLPEEISGSLSQLLLTFVNFVQIYPKAQEEREKLKKEAEAEELEFKANPGRNFDEYDETETEEQENEIEIENENEVEIDENEIDEEDDDESYDNEWEDSDELEEDLYFECPLDSLDFSQLIRSTFIDLSKKSNWSKLTSTLTPEHLSIIQQICL